jgi:hypothetical protein
MQDDDCVITAVISPDIFILRDFLIHVLIKFLDKSSWCALRGTSVIAKRKLDELSLYRFFDQPHPATSEKLALDARMKILYCVLRSFRTPIYALVHAVKTHLNMNLPLNDAVILEHLLARAEEHASTELVYAIVEVLLAGQRATLAHCFERIKHLFVGPLPLLLP